ncbi:type II toxin-antitoxin system RelE/ParE family toxin [Granulicella sp. dw_53]|uniref:type II toxin-antitoxin system RelE/ParE family toxin n=1 Tax=Granulicella sp. dw_53 TaxID=2719792 RepID=UPI001BD40933|nr:type II toxin-antitoxin system RelE/ParE family toxin [Granulicella sp. dw_53]
MVFEVVITDAALADAEDYVTFIRTEQEEPSAAERWWNGLLEAIFSLEQMPERCALIPERSHFSEDLRHLIYFSHRIIFSVTSNEVVILRIYHVSRQPIR